MKWGKVDGRHVARNLVVSYKEEKMVDVFDVHNG